MGKGIVVVSDIATGVAFSNAIASSIRNNTEFIGFAKAISSNTNPSEVEILIGRFHEQNDPFSLLISSGSFLTGLDNPLIHTIYLTCPVSTLLRSHLVGVVNRIHKGKKDALIVDYVGQEWGRLSIIP